MKLSMQCCELIWEFGEERAFQILKEAGFEGVDYFIGHACDEIKGDYQSIARGTKQALDKSGISCEQVHAPFDFPFEEVEENYVYIVRAIEMAGILESPYIVVHPVIPPKTMDFLECNRRFFKSLESHAKRAGVVIAIENLYHRDSKRNGITNDYFANPVTLRDFVRSLCSEAFAVCIDIGHASLTPTEPDDFIRVFDNKLLKVLHVHDTDYLADRHTLPGFGCLNWDSITKALGEIDYQGTFSFEINQYINGFRRNGLDREVIPDAVNFAAKVGRKLIERIESTRKWQEDE